MRNALLISNSTSHGSGYLDHCESDIMTRMKGIDDILFIPYAKPDMDTYKDKAERRFKEMGMDLVSIHNVKGPATAIEDAAALFVGGGNTFLLLKKLYDEGLLSLIRERVEEGMIYIGTSAGSNVACATINTTNDMPIVHPPSFDAIGMVPFALNPHYIDPDPDSTHKGETRIQRIKEFHMISDLPVVGLREGAMLDVAGNRMRLKGPTGARVFIKGKHSDEYEPGSDLSFLLVD